MVLRNVFGKALEESHADVKVALVATGGYGQVFASTSNPPAVTAAEFYNPVQDFIARLYGAAAGYSTSLSYEEFLLNAPGVAPAVGDPFGTELGVISNPMGGSIYTPVPAVGPNEHGVYRIFGVAAGDRGGPPGFQVGDGLRYLGARRWIFRCRLRCSKFSVLTGADPGAPTGGAAFHDNRVRITAR